MAKRRSAEDDSKIIDFAEDLGRLLGTAERKANEWLSQREEITKRLTELQNKAGQLLTALGESPLPWAAKRKPGRPPGSTKAAGAAAAASAGATKRKRSKMSAAQRKAVGERMRKYWAARRKAEAAK